MRSQTGASFWRIRNKRIRSLIWTNRIKSFTNTQGNSLGKPHIALANTTHRVSFSHLMGPAKDMENTNTPNNQYTDSR